MRILIVHNRYQQRGGEDTVVANEEALLRSKGHEVQRLDADNEHIHGLISRVQTAAQSVYSLSGRKRLHTAIRSFAPEIVHVHNFFPTLSPAIFTEVAAAGVPAVLTLHNYRLVCAASTLYRDGHVCEDCVTARSFLPGVRHACYRSSRFGSAVLGFGMALHQTIGTWSNDVAAYIALTAFAADKLGEFRLPRNRIHVKPNFVEDRGVGDGSGAYALFVGRLSEEKGIQTLIDADTSGALPLDVVVVGDGPMRPALEAAATRAGSRLRLKGLQARDETLEYMKGARVLMVPSLWYEGQPMVYIEALSLGLPVIAAELGSFAAHLEVSGAGLTFATGNAEALATALHRFAPGIDTAAMRRAARAEYLTFYTPDQNHQRLMEIYRAAQETASPA